jgi:hypothetical protein
MNYEKSASMMTQNGYEQAKQWLTLGHELAHAFDYSEGTIDNKLWYTNHKELYVKNSEKYATHIENKMRAEANLPLRTHYSAEKIFDENNNLITVKGVEGTRIINSNGRSLFYTYTHSYAIIDLRGISSGVVNVSDVKKMVVGHIYMGTGDLNKDLDYLVPQ